MVMNVNLPRRAFVRRVSRHLNKHLTLNRILLCTYLNCTISAIKTKTTANTLIFPALSHVYPPPIRVTYLTYTSIYTYYYNNVLICVVTYYIINCAQGRARLWRAPGDLDLPDPLVFLGEYKQLNCRGIK